MIFEKTKQNEKRKKAKKVRNVPQVTGGAISQEGAL